MSFYFFIVKDKPHRIGGTSLFNITKEALKECGMTHFQYAVTLAKKKEEEQKEMEKREKITCSSNTTFRQKNQVYNQLHTMPH